jgi:hypothetical protein
MNEEPSFSHPALCNPTCLNGGACVPSTNTANRCQCPVNPQNVQLWTGSVCQTGMLPVFCFVDTRQLSAAPAVTRGLA